MNTTTIVKPNGPPIAKTASKMSLDNTRDGIIDSPMRILIAGGEKVGKSTFASGAPGGIFLGADAGTEHLNVKRFAQPENFRDVLEALHELESRGLAKGFQSLVIDPINWFEPMLVADVLGDSGKGLADWGGGYGRGTQAVMDRWRTMKSAVERVWQTGMNVIMTAHVHVKKFEDPEGPGFERYELAMKPEAAGIFKQWADCILFARREAFGKIDAATKKAKAYGSAARMLHTEWSPAYDAGNRWCLPAEIPLSWPAFVDARAAGLGRRAEFLAQIESGLVELADPEVEKKVRGLLADPQVNVAELANAVAAKVGERRGGIVNATGTGG
jgi:hypothetical protein